VSINYRTNHSVGPALPDTASWVSGAATWDILALLLPYRSKPRLNNVTTVVCAHPSHAAAYGGHNDQLGICVYVSVR
jgi:hypothetical protein